MNAFETLVADFAEKTGVEPGKPGADSFDVVADAFAVSDVTKGSNFRGLGNFGRQTSGFDLLLFSLSRSGRRDSI